MKTTTAQTSEFTLTASAVIQAAGTDGGGKPRLRRFDMNAYNGGPMKLRGWQYPVVVDLTGVFGADGARPIFLNHSEDRIVGHADAIKVDPTGINASGVISGAGDAAKEVLQAHDNGFPWQASIGARPDKVEFLERGQTATVNNKTVTGPLNIARKTTLGEISFVPIGADPSTSVRIAANANRGKKKMDLDEQTNDVQNDPVVAERQRIGSIAKIFAKEQYQYMDAKKRQTIQASAIDEGWDVEKAELELLRAARPSGLISTQPRTDNIDSGQAIAAGMCMNLGLGEKFLAKHFDQRTMDAATTKELRTAGIHTLLRTVIRAAGRPAPERIDDEAIRCAFEADRWLRASGGAGFSSLGLVNVLANVQNKVMLDTYNAVGTSWQLFCTTNSNNDFKPGLSIRLIGDGKFQPVADNGELANIGLQDQGFPTQLNSEGCIIVIGRQTIINDDQGALTQQTKVLARQGAIALEKAVYTLLLSNPLVKITERPVTTANFFSANNSNYQSGAGTALGVNSLTLAEQLMMKQITPNGDPALITPKVLLVPPELSVMASTLTRSAEIRDTTANTKYPTVNPHAGRFTVGTSPWLSAASLTGNSMAAWYLFGDPGDVAAMEVTYLNGQSSPTIQAGEPNFNVLGFALRAFFDFGAAMLDPRAGVFSTGD